MLAHDAKTLGLEVAHTDRDHIVGTWRNVLVCIWRRETHVVAIRNMKPVLDRLKSANPGGVAMLTVLEQHASLPTTEARDEMPKFFKDVAKGMACSALVFEGVGFRSAAIRALTTTFNLLAAQPFPHRVFASVTDAEAMLLERLPPSAKGQKLSPGDLGVVVNALRERFDAATKGP